MLMSDETKNKLNELVTETFQMNSFCDNVAYNLDFSVYANASDVFHHSVAHHFPGLADTITDLMIKLNARPIRGALEANEEDYSGDLARMFADVATVFENYRKKIIEAIELSEFNSDYEVKIFLEEFLLRFAPYNKQADIWKVEAERYSNDYKSFDARIKTFTTAIDIVG